MSSSPYCRNLTLRLSPSQPCRVKAAQHCLNWGMRQSVGAARVYREGWGEGAVEGEVTQSSASATHRCTALGQQPTHLAHI